MALLSAVAVVSACAAPVAQGVQDPFEEQNRRVHEFNKSLDSRLIRPFSRVFGEDASGPVAAGIDNAADNLRLPGDIANHLLQFRLEDAVHNTVRLALNTTIGLGGLFDPADAIGLTARNTDFGATLHIWGMGEGDFLELPLIGPTTERDALGIVVDVALDPLGFIFPAPESYYARGLNILSRLGDRARFSRTIDSILYESADSYAQSRLLYLQNRRFELGQEASDDEFFDPYEDF